MRLRPLLDELCLARTRAALRDAVARLGCELSGASRCSWLLDPEGGLPGRCALAMEPQEEGGEVALPGLLHGEVVGVLLAAAPADREPLQTLAALAAAATRWVGLAEDAEARAAAALDEAVAAREALAGTPGLAAATGRVASELGRVAGLPAGERNRLWQAARWPDPTLPAASADLLALARDAAGSRRADSREHGEWVLDFLRSRLERHPVPALEALGLLEDEGRLAPLLEGSAP